MTAAHRRSLRIEPLEARRLLAITVNTLADEADGSIVDGDISLRDAIALAPPGETINFDPALTAGGPATLNLTVPSAITIGKALTISGPGADLLTIDASVNDPTPNVNNRDGHRIFLITDNLATFAAVTMEGLTLTGADIGGFGGAIDSSENLTLRNMVIRGNSAQGGGGVGATGPLSIFDSDVSNNVSSSAGAGIHVHPTANGTYQIVRTTVSNNQILSSVSARGGGIFSNVPTNSSFLVIDSTVISNTATLDGAGIASIGPLVVTNSAIVNNHSNGNGGGIKASGFVTVEDSLLYGNAAVDGGGIHADTVATLRASTFANNTATGAGAGVYLQNGQSQLTQVTIMGNRANGSGGGIYSALPFELHHSTLANNWADFDGSNGGVGGGIVYVLPGGSPVVLDHTILANNIHGAAVGDDAVGPFAARYSIIGISDSPGLSLTDNGGNQSGTLAAPLNAMLSSLAANDGPILHSGYTLLTASPDVGSPAIDAGDPFANSGSGTTPALDQRGTGFTRVYNATGLTIARIDVGAVEVQPSPLAGDYNFDGVVNAADYTVWRNTVGSPVDKRADGNRDGAVDKLDHGVWRAHYGETLAMGGAAGGAALGRSR